MSDEHEMLRDVQMVEEHRAYRCWLLQGNHAHCGCPNIYDLANRWTEMPRMEEAMPYLIAWVILFLFLAIAGILYEAWKAASAIAKDRTKSLDRYY